MSSYPVHIVEWFKDQPDKLNTMSVVFDCMVENGDDYCVACKDKVEFKDAWMLHVVPYGLGIFTVWCKDCGS
jgi:hypothetical protein